MHVNCDTDCGMYYDDYCVVFVDAWCGVLIWGRALRVVCWLVVSWLALPARDVFFV